jgi:hypothetical protein
MALSENPTYQRRMARVMALPPEKQAILGIQAAAVGQQTAEEDARKQLALQRLGNAKQAQESNLALQSQGIQQSGDIMGGRLEQARDVVDFTNRQNQQALGLGALNLGMSGALGYGQMKDEQARADQLTDLTKKLNALAALGQY